MAIFFFVVATISTSELFRLISKFDVAPQELMGGVLSKLVFLIPVAYFMELIPLKWITLIVLAFFILPIIELFRKKHQASLNMALGYFPSFFLSLPLVLLMDIALKSDVYNPYLILGFFILIWVYDTGAYLSGMFLGKHKLFERISPKKTWEGLVGGAIISMLVAVFIVTYFIPDLLAWQWAVVALIVVVFGTFGDLVESMLKRNANVKDSGAFMPGHGGMLDRFDSAFMAAPFFWLFIQWI
jgi:phosphatidate cytidylyltransferase